MRADLSFSTNEIQALRSPGFAQTTGGYGAGRAHHTPLETSETDNRFRDHIRGAQFPYCATGRRRLPELRIHGVSAGPMKTH